ncbi:cytochrome P450 [Abortiporus biennis]|nr:cytochrome P450 [Abortiporus biennis]
MASFIFLYLVAISSVYFLRRLLSRGQRLKQPPGPKGLPILGNLFDVPATDTEPQKTFLQWSQKYGSNLLYISLPSQPTLIVNSAEVALNLLEKRSHIYSDRAVSTIDELVGLDFIFGMMPYAAKWRSHRKLFHQYFNSNAISQYLPCQLFSIRAFLWRSLQPTHDLQQSINLMFGSLILKVVYGADVDDLKHEYINLAHEVMDIANEAHTIGKFWIDYFPFFKNVPGWLPGVHFKRFAEMKRPILEKAKRKPYEDVKIAAAKGNAQPSMAYLLLEKLQRSRKEMSLEEYLQQEDMVIGTTGIAYSGGVDTSAASSQSFILSMAMHPDIQRKAQMEIDAHINLDRLPDDSDYGSLPYIRAIILEVMRWRPVTPLGFPHRLTEDDEYNGYFIRKGTVVYTNIWAMTRDPIEYPDPETFNPERFLKDGQLDPTVRDPRTLTFGFGRRICPGREFSTQTIFLFVASVLQIYNIEPAKDENGKSVDLHSIKYTSGGILAPKSLPCVLTPRSEAAQRLILQSE